MGWCHNQRNFGALIFLTLRDRSGELQLVVDDQAPEELRRTASDVRSEYVLAAKGHLECRLSPNAKMATGAFELIVTELRILSRAETPPFYIENEVDANEALRLKHRYLDLRRPVMQRNLMVRDQITRITHSYFAEEGFLDIETPMLGRSTPEGARDYLVPSRVKPGSFFALPQSPQLYKQLLMVAGMDRYIQIARCFRDEDLRADRQPEFTQVDLEMSFVTPDDVMDVVERYVARLFAEVLKEDVKLPLRRMTWAEAMRRFGSDKPDLRFGMELQDLSDFFRDTEFAPFCQALDAGASVTAIVVPGGASLSRKKIDALSEYAKTYRLHGLAWLVVNGEEIRGSAAKALGAETASALAGKLSASGEDLVLMAADETSRLRVAMGQLRCEVARRLEMIRPGHHELLWVTEFPLFEYSEEEKRLVAMHHPFTAPMDEDRALLDTDPARVRAQAYDIVLDGTELGGGSIRIHDAELQSKMFGLLGFTPERARANFAFLLDAFKYGVPPHGGCALGLDRLVMLFLGAASIRDVIAFPKVQTSSDLMTDAPSPVAREQLEELRIRLAEETPAEQI